MTRFRGWVALGALVTLLLGACQAGPMAFDEADAGFVSMPAEAGSGGEMMLGKATRRASEAAALGDDASRGTTPSEPAPDRMLVYTGSLALEVARPDEAAAKFLALVKEWQGHLAQQQGFTYSVRIPAARFDEAFVQLKTWGRVLDEQRTASDVTEEFLDLGIRLDNARKSRDRLLALLEKADKVEDILKVEEQLRRLTEEIERMEGRRKFLADQVAMSTLTVTFTAVADMGPQHRRRTASRFDWVNQMGVDHVLRHF